MTEEVLNKMGKAANASDANANQAASGDANAQSTATSGSTESNK